MDSGSSDAPTESIHVFLSYRRSDDVNFIGRFHDRMIDEFGEANVFRDIDSIQPGVDFSRVIRETIEACDVVVTMIGPQWSSRVREADDFVRMEVHAALSSGAAIVPILIDDSTMPLADELPEDLRPLLALNIVRVRRDPDFRRDASRAIGGIRALVGEARRRERAEAQELASRLAAAELLESERRERLEQLSAARKAQEIEVERLEREAVSRRLELEQARLAALHDEEELAEAARAAAAAALEAARKARQEVPAPAVSGPVVPPSSQPVVPAPSPPDVPLSPRAPVGGTSHRKTVAVAVVVGVASVAAVIIAVLISSLNEPESSSSSTSLGVVTTSINVPTTTSAPDRTTTEPHPTTTKPPETTQPEATLPDSAFQEILLNQSDLPPGFRHVTSGTPIPGLLLLPATDPPTDWTGWTDPDLACAYLNPGQTEEGHSLDSRYFQNTAGDQVLTFAFAGSTSVGETGVVSNGQCSLTYNKDSGLKYLFQPPSVDGVLVASSFDIVDNTGTSQMTGLHTEKGYTTVMLIVQCWSSSGFDCTSIITTAIQKADTAVAAL